MNSNPLDLGRANASGPQFRILQNVHESFVRSVETALSAFLQSEIKASVGEISTVTAAAFLKPLRSPACLIALRLHPRRERILLFFDSGTVFTLLDLLLGGQGEAGPAEPRPLTEIEWSLFEEVVRVVLRSLGEAWRVFHEVEFEVESLESDPSVLPCPDPAAPMVRLEFKLQMRDQAGSLEIAVPRQFFETAAPPEQPQPAADAPDSADFERNLALLGNAAVELEVKLQGPKLAFKALMELKPGQVLSFDYPLRKPIHASVNGTVALAGHIVSAGRKRAFQIEQLP